MAKAMQQTFPCDDPATSLRLQAADLLHLATEARSETVARHLRASAAECARLAALIERRRHRGEHVIALGRGPVRRSAAGRSD
jgi:hypothetical protein